MIELYMWPTGNGKKIAIMLEECELAYEAFPINIGTGDQLTPAFLSISPNGKIPAIIDHDTHGAPLRLFESGAILQYLAEKHGRFLPLEHGGNRFSVLQWLNWQIGGLGPMAGQAHHFLRYAQEAHPYAMARYKAEVSRLYLVLEKQLADRDYVCDEYSIADMAIWPWIARHEWQEQNLDDYPQIKRWFNRVAGRAAVQRALQVGCDWMEKSVQLSDQDQQRLLALTP